MIGWALGQQTNLAQRLPGELVENVVEYQRHLMKLRKQRINMLGHIENVGETPVYFNMPLNVTVEEIGIKTVLIRSNEKARMTITLHVLADGRKLPPYVILR
jgi:hypothetical protein